MIPYHFTNSCFFAYQQIFLPAFHDQAVQHEESDTSLTVTSSSDQATQSDTGEDQLDTGSQTDFENPPTIPFSNAVSQTDHPARTSQSTQSSVPSADHAIQSEISGDVTAFPDYARVVEESQSLHSRLGTLTAAHERAQREVERLRAHLLQVEQGFALDFQLAEQRESELKELVQQLESHVAIESATERSATLETQFRMEELIAEARILTEARDWSVMKLQEAEKKNGQLETSLANLRLAFDHIQLEQRTEIEQEKERSRRALRSLEDRVAALLTEKSALERKAAETASLLQVCRAVQGEYQDGIFFFVSNF